MWRALLQSAAAPAIKALYFQAGPWGPFGTDTPGHEAMRSAVGDVTPSDGYIAGWTWSYPLLAALEKAASDGDGAGADSAVAVPPSTVLASVRSPSLVT